MTNNVYLKSKETITKYVSELLDEKDDQYLCSNKKRVIEKFIEEICNESKSKMKGCTEIETLTYRTMLGLNTDGEKKNYKQVREILKGGNTRAAILNTNRKLMSEIYKELLFENKVKLIQEGYKYKENKGMFLPEDIDIEDLRSIIYFEKDILKELGIENVFDLTSFSIEEIEDLISCLKTRRKHNRENVAKELIEAIHMLGYLFIEEEGYEEQIKEFDDLRRIMETEDKNINEDEKEIKKAIKYRNDLVSSYNTLKKIRKHNFDVSSIDKELEETKQRIIQAEGTIRKRKI